MATARLVSIDGLTRELEMKLGAEPLPKILKTYGLKSITPVVFVEDCSVHPTEEVVSRNYRFSHMESNAYVYREEVK